MKAILVELDEETSSALEEVAPATTRSRSEFIRQAIRRALWDVEERATKAAYERDVDTGPAYFDPAVWESADPKPRRKRPRKGK